MSSTPALPLDSARPVDSTRLFDSARPFDVVLFDFDGTLADTAEDLIAPVNQMRVERGLAPMSVPELRPHASAGARGLLGHGLGVKVDDPRFPELREDFLRRYEAAIAVHTRLFPGMPELLESLEAAGIRWGIVSNKMERYCRIIARALELESRSAVVIGGDTAARPKPAPDPLLHAAESMRVRPDRCLYVGDDLRDIKSGHAAGMRTVAAAYGYCGDAMPVAQWGAEFLIEHPRELLPIVGLSSARAPA